MRAMQEHDIPVDCVGGTSTGSIFGTLIAMQIDIGDMIEMFRAGFFHNKQLSDYTLRSIAMLRVSKLHHLLQQYLDIEYIGNL